VHDLDTVLRFLGSSFTLYLRISGQFHLIIGVLCLFGFNLPETHHLYFLASGFTDLWRRVNIYWKDFMMKIFFYPMFIKIQRKRPLTGLVVSTVLVFYISWALHSFQWFWIRGSFPVTVMDAIFWTIFASAVLTKTSEMNAMGRITAWAAAGALRPDRTRADSATPRAAKLVAPTTKETAAAGAFSHSTSTP